MKTVLSVFGTRPDVIKMAPLIKELEKYQEIKSFTCVTGQHREMLDQFLECFDITPNFDLNVMRPNQSLTQLTTKIMLSLERVIQLTQSDLVLVHGDTTTAMTAAWSAYNQHVPIGHLEAGLRTYDIDSSKPEEGNRQIADLFALLHFAPSKQCADNLINERKLASGIYVTGNTVVDVLLDTKRKLQNNKERVEAIKKQLKILDFTKKHILITGHRRENFGCIDSICSAIKYLAQLYPNYEFVYSVHPNPQVRSPVYQLLNNLPNVKLIDPQPYDAFVYLMSNSHLILTDSGGIQEEAPILGIPVLVMRDTTERTEALKAGSLELVGTEKQSIVSGVNKLITDTEHYQYMSQKINPYGDGTASQKIATIVRDFLLSDCTAQC